MKRACVLILVLLVACKRHRDEPVSAPSPVAQQPTGPRAESCSADAVMTSGGCVRGERADQLAIFRGIPYAAPPVGALRWKLPQAAPTWSGVRDTIAFGRSCPQLDDTIGGKLAWNEDCLTLNVWAPSRSAAPAKLPVMVWIHGGGLVQGGSALPVYDGAHLAAAGLVIVSINYRLGPLGFLAHPALTAEDPHHVSGNLGLHDQIAALEWVKHNIAAFGGDPMQVTIFGESAGGESVCALMASPLANGLFARGIIESAQCVGYGKAARALHVAKGSGAAAESGEDQGLRVAKALGCTGDNALACMRAKPAEELLRASPAALGFLGKGEHYGLTIDGWALTEAPATLLETGKLANVPMIVGSTADEATLFTAKLRLKRAAGYEFIVKRVFPGTADKVLAAYPASAFPSPKAAFEALVTDVVFTCPTRRAARAMRKQQPLVFRYLFTHVTTRARDAGMGASHGSEIPFVFGTSTSPTDDERKLSAAMLAYWASFAKTGDPGHTGAPPWPAYDAAADTYIELGDTIATKSNLHGSRCDVLDAVSPALHDADEE